MNFLWTKSYLVHLWPGARNWMETFGAYYIQLTNEELKGLRDCNMQN